LTNGLQRSAELVSGVVVLSVLAGAALGHLATAVPDRTYVRSLT